VVKGVAVADWSSAAPFTTALGIAVENAHQEVRKVADQVTASNDEVGDALVLERPAEEVLAWRGA
jgi:hypothetical protein